MHGTLLKNLWPFWDCKELELLAGIPLERENTCDGCLDCQQYKSSKRKRFSTPQSLEAFQRRWGSISTDFIAHPPRASKGFNTMTAWADRFSRRNHFIPSRMEDIASDCAKSFLKKHGHIMVFQTELQGTGTLSLRPSLVRS